MINLPLIARIEERALQCFLVNDKSIKKPVLVECFGCDSYGYVEKHSYYCPNCGCTGGMFDRDFDDLKDITGDYIL